MTSLSSTRYDGSRMMATSSSFFARTNSEKTLLSKSNLSATLFPFKKSQIGLPRRLLMQLKRHKDESYLSELGECLNTAKSVSRSSRDSFHQTTTSSMKHFQGKKQLSTLNSLPGAHELSMQDDSSDKKSSKLNKIDVLQQNRRAQRRLKQYLTGNNASSLLKESIQIIKFKTAQQYDTKRAQFNLPPARESTQAGNSKTVTIDNSREILGSPTDFTKTQSVLRMSKLSSTALAKLIDKSNLTTLLVPRLTQKVQDQKQERDRQRYELKDKEQLLKKISSKSLHISLQNGEEGTEVFELILKQKQEEYKQIELQLFNAIFVRDRYLKMKIQQKNELERAQKKVFLESTLHSQCKQYAQQQEGALLMETHEIEEVLNQMNHLSKEEKLKNTMKLRLYSDLLSRKSLQEMAGQHMEYETRTRNLYSQKRLLEVQEHLQVQRAEKQRLHQELEAQSLDQDRRLNAIKKFFENHKEAAFVSVEDALDLCLSAKQSTAQMKYDIERTQEDIATVNQEIQTLRQKLHSLQYDNHQNSSQELQEIAAFNNAYNIKDQNESVRLLSLLQQVMEKEKLQYQQAEYENSETPDSIIENQFSVEALPNTLLFMIEEFGMLQKLIANKQNTKSLSHINMKN